MREFNDQEYTRLISDLLNDTQYVKLSNMGKVSGLRKHGEVLVRKILNIGSDIKFTLGQVRKNSINTLVNESLDKLTPDLKINLIETVNRITPLGNAGTHTQRTEDFTDNDIFMLEDAILDLYAFIFIKFFSECTIDLYFSPNILSEFSLLPPVIRYKTWNYLFKKDPNNIQVVNKLCLSIIKAFDKETAYNWLEENKSTIRDIPYPNRYHIKKYNDKCGVKIAPGVYKVNINFASYDNMYDLLYDKIKDPNTSINESGKMYDKFEQSLLYYDIEYNLGNIKHDSDKEVIFHSLVKFAYIGRKPDETKKDNINTLEEKVCRKQIDYQPDIRLSKDFFKNNPLDDFCYSWLLLQCLDSSSHILNIFPHLSMYEKNISKLQTNHQIFQYMKNMFLYSPAGSFDVLPLRRKILSIEDKVVPFLLEKYRESSHDNFIQACFYIFSVIDMKYIDELYNFYKEIRSPLAQSIACIIFAVHKRKDMLSFLVEEYNRLLTSYPKENYYEGPLSAIYYLNDVTP